ncbi:MAG TPA: DUF3667 domain-containing protein, partial [Gammaproteobacteria bacterium]
MNGANCVNCGAVLHGPYCAQCGEKRIPPEGYTLRGIARDWQLAISHGEGKLLRSLRLLITRPGLLTAEYFHGRRVPYSRPASLFLTCNLLFFLLCNWDTFTTPLSTHLHDSDMLHRGVARVLVKDQALGRDAVPARWDAAYAALEGGRMTAAQPDAVALQAYALRFNTRERLLSRTLIAAIIPITALFAWCLLGFLRQGLPKQLIFSAHVWSFFLLLITGLNGLVLGLYEAVFRLTGYTGLAVLGSNAVFSSLLLV